MKTPAPFAQEIAAFPAALRKLIEAELKAGNKIVELSSSFPAPPAGAYVKLEKPVSTRPRKTSRGVNFYDRNSSSYSGEFTDAKRFYFVLEPPRPPEPPPDMNAIRAQLEAKQRASDAALYEAQRTGKQKKSKRYVEAVPSLIPPQPTRAATPRVETAVERFRESMVVNYERWHEGIGYDIAIFKTATPEELVDIENLLLARGVDDWRDVEALAALDSPRARVALRKALNSSNHRVRIAVAEHASDLISAAERTAALVHALEGADTYGGLTQALLQIEEFHPPQIIDALLRGVLTRTEGQPVHFAAMLMFLHGKTQSAFDWDQRPFFLEFKTDDSAKRRALFRDLCARIGVDPEKYLEEKTVSPAAKSDLNP